MGALELLETCAEDFAGRRLQRVVHIEFDRMRRHLEALHLGHLQFDEGVDEVVVKHAADLEEGAILIEVFQRFAQ